MSKNKNENLETMWKYLLTNRIVALMVNSELAYRPMEH